MILKLIKEINDLNRALDSINEAPTSVVKESCNVSYTLVEKIEKIECVTSPSLKLEN